MKPGLVGSVLVLLAGGAAGGAVVLKDQSKLQRASKARDQGLALLKERKLDEAHDKLKLALVAAGQVSGYAGKRGDALKVSASVREGLGLLSLLRRYPELPFDTLALLELESSLPEDAPKRLKGERAELLLDAALRLERSGCVEQAEPVYKLALHALTEVKSERVGEAQRGRLRMQLRANLLTAEKKLSLGDKAGARRGVKKARAALSGEARPFRDPERVKAFTGRIEAIERELKSLKLLATFKSDVDALYARVPTPALGTLAEAARKLQAPTLPGKHPRAKKHAEDLGAIKRVMARIRTTTEAFRGMVFLRVSERGRLYVDRCEVSNRDYLAFVTDAKVKPYATPGHEVWTLSGRKAPPLKGFVSQGKGHGPASWKDGRPDPALLDHPVVGVSAREAEAFARWRGKELPTHEQFRAVWGPGKLPWGDAKWERKTQQRTHANTHHKAKKDKHTVPVDSYPKGRAPCGALHLVGNAAEIVRTPKAKTPYLALGHSFASVFSPTTMNSAKERGTRLSINERREAHLDLGFRCVKELEWK